MRDQRGFTVVGALVAAVVVGAVALLAADLLGRNSQLLSSTKQKRDRDRIVASILSGVMEELPILQRSFNSSDEFRDNMLQTDKLPYAWDQNQVVPAGKCASCPGRMGYVLQPMPGRSGLNRLTVRVTHTALFKGYRDYVYILADD